MLSVVSENIIKEGTYTLDSNPDGHTDIWPQAQGMLNTKGLSEDSQEKEHFIVWYQTQAKDESAGNGKINGLSSSKEQSKPKMSDMATGNHNMIRADNYNTI